jgi:tetratricopeptide (TPR) repeat protein
MKIKIYFFAFAMLMAVSASAQSVDYENRYRLLVSRVGAGGVGVETVLEKWQAEDSTGRKVLSAWFEYYFTKSQSEQVVKKSQKKYLGMQPLLSLKDTAGVPVYYFQEKFFDDELFAKALKTADKLAALYPDDLDYRFLKANALVAYEKESPDMAYAYLSDLITENATRTRPWNYEGNKMEPEFFPEAMHEYCCSFYDVGGDAAMNVFYKLSERLYEMYPSEVCFLSNMATYHLVSRNDPKTALKIYNKVLKKVKDDQVALRNSYVAASKLGSDKLKEKYHKLLVQYGYTK